MSERGAGYNSYFSIWPQRVHNRLKIVGGRGRCESYVRVLSSDSLWVSGTILRTSFHYNEYPGLSHSLWSSSGIGDKLKYYQYWRFHQFPTCSWLKTIV